MQAAYLEYFLNCELVFCIFRFAKSLQHQASRYSMGFNDFNRSAPSMLSMYGWEQKEAF